MGGSEAPGERVLKILLFYFFQATENIGRFCGMALALHKCVPLTGIFPESNLPRIDLLKCEGLHYFLRIFLLSIEIYFTSDFRLVYLLTSKMAV